MAPSIMPLFGAASEEENEWLSQARNGDLNAMDHLICRHQPWVFNLALRMVWRRDVAEDATQDIFLKAVTRLNTFEGRSQFSTWLYRIAVNHLLDVRKSEIEAKSMTFADLGRSLAECEDRDLPDEAALPGDRALVIEEAKLGCIGAMLLCLDRRQRLAFILGEIFDVSSEIGAEVMEISPANFRQLLSRARQDLYQFMNEKCGLVNVANPCRCTKKAAAFMKNGWLDPQRRQFTVNRLANVRESAPRRLEELEALDRAHGEVYRSIPLSDAPEIARRLRSALAASTFAFEPAPAEKKAGDSVTSPRPFRQTGHGHINHS